MTAPAARLLVVEDDDAERDALARLLRLEGYQVVTARHPQQALADQSGPIDLVLSDLRMGRQTGLELLAAWRSSRPATPFILLTAFGTVASAVEAMKLGATDFLSKPVDPQQLLDLVAQALAARRGFSSVSDGGCGSWEGIVGRSAPMAAVADETRRAAAADSTVLVLGESGTGKELVAAAIHRLSPRRNGPLVVVNMAAVAEPLVESELFGHVKGAFTGAVAARTGRFEAAHRGALFIDEIGDFPLHMQAKLLRVLETKSFTPVGGERDISVDVRVVAATSRDLAALQAQGAFRPDLYYRLNVLTIRLPPLRSRRSDIPLLVEHFLGQFARQANRPPIACSPELLAALEEYDWPGNVRQLRNCLERMTVMTNGTLLTPDDLPAEFCGSLAQVPTDSEHRLETLKRSAMMQALSRFDGNRTQAAKYLGISVRTLQRKLREWDNTTGPPGDS